MRLPASAVLAVAAVLLSYIVTLAVISQVCSPLLTALLGTPAAPMHCTSCMAGAEGSVDVIRSLPSHGAHRAGSGPKVIVVGGGLAGMSAAIEAASHGASVVLVDKEKV